MSDWYSKIPHELRITFLLIFLVLSACHLAIVFYQKVAKSDLSKELLLRTHTWWKIAIGVFVVTALPSIYGTVLVAFISYSALREMLSISPLRASDRMAMVLCYLSVPVQFYIVHQGYYNSFLIFIPIIIFIGIPTILVFVGNTKGIGRSMSLIPTILILTVFMPSHLLMIFHLENPDLEVTGSMMVMFVILLVAFNDIFQFTWGKLLGTKKILPQISTNKTWEGLIFGLITTASFAYFLKMLTTFTGYQAFFVGLLVGFCGFIGDAILSAIKRDLKIKDTGSMVPGHGGIMDRLDSLIIAVPVYYHLLKYLIENS
ncbi:MAG: CDP-archaeol synthase [Bacteroidia bacterium]|nr:CDP-archaeol synthase [Bacteroidia bacterium]NNJ55611.1 CDP-archaeol synthase [Bacteroidia bacterium]